MTKKKTNDEPATLTPAEEEFVTGLEKGTGVTLDKDIEKPIYTEKALAKAKAEAEKSKKSQV